MAHTHFVRLGLRRELEHASPMGRASGAGFSPRRPSEGRNEDHCRGKTRRAAVGNSGQEMLVTSPRIWFWIRQGSSMPRSATIFATVQRARPGSISRFSATHKNFSRSGATGANS
jgi:hypothetical protein